MIELLGIESDEDLDYLDEEVSRTIGIVNADFMHMDTADPILHAIDTARAQGKVCLLDAGCGSGRSLSDFKDQISFRAPIAETSIDALGVSISDLRPQFKKWGEDRRRLYNGYISLALGNLATIALQPDHYDVAYSYQVLLHNKQITPIIRNIIPSLCLGGAYYFDVLLEQQHELDGLVADLDTANWTVETKPLTRRFIGGEETRLMGKITRVAS